MAETVEEAGSAGVRRRRLGLPDLVGSAGVNAVDA